MNSSHEACSKTSNDKIRIALEPLGKQFEVERGTALQDILFQHGVEFPCGGQGQCKGCRVRVVHGSLAVDDHAAETNDHHASLLSDEELAAGWRLACCCRADGDLVLDVGQWEQPILADDSHFAFTPREGLGIAIDLGTTTLVAQLVDRRTGHVLAVESALNPQAAHGADLMSRVQFGTTPTNREILTQQIRSTLGQMVRNLLATQSSMTSSPSSMLDVRRVVIVGNTVMNYLFCGLDLTSIANAPFEIESIGPQSFSAKQLDWNVPGEPCIEFLPSLGGFVGSDILAGILATRLHESDELVALVDLGTNGEIVVGNCHRILCASTAAGPAFEGARVRRGMRAATGAISSVRAHPASTTEQASLFCHVIGNGSPRGICGSGLIDAVAMGLDLGIIEPSGRLANGTKEFILAEPVRLYSSDIRELQLAKAAIAAGLELLLNRWDATQNQPCGTARSQLTRLYIAGAFGNHINLTSAVRIGLINWPTDMPSPVLFPAGNTALLGAKIALFEPDEKPNSRDKACTYDHIRRLVQHMPLASDPKFMDAYVAAMPFPNL